MTQGENCGLTSGNFMTNCVNYMSLWKIGSTEWVVIGAVLLGLVLFEAGPKLLNFKKKKKK